MSIEAIPKDFEQPYNPLADVDHEKIVLYTEGRLLSGKGLTKELQRIYSFNRHFNPELLERLINRGKYLEPVDEELRIQDEELHRIRAFNAGCALALLALDNFAEETGVDRKQWREHWVRLPEGADAPIAVPEGQVMTMHDCQRVGAAIIEVGQRQLSMLEQPYHHLVEVVDANRPENFAHSNVFQSSFGYVFGVGRTVVSGIVFNREADVVVTRYTPTKELLDEELKQLVRNERRRSRALERQKRTDSR